jgi:exosortase/archaeosortase family protein
MVLHVVDGSVQVKGLILFRNNFSNAVKIDSSCSALSFVMIMSSALLAFPSNWNTRIKSLILACFFVQTINVIRIISLLYVQGSFSTATFDFIHAELWPFLMILVLGTYYLLWAQIQYRQMHNSQGLDN